MVSSKFWILGILSFPVGISLGLFSIGSDASVHQWLSVPVALFLSFMTTLALPLMILSFVQVPLLADNMLSPFKIALSCFVYFLVTTIIAVLIGLTVAKIVQPGKSAQLHQSHTSLSVEKKPLPSSLPGRLLSGIGKNPFVQFLKHGVLDIMLYSLTLGIFLRLFLQPQSLQWMLTVLSLAQRGIMVLVNGGLKVLPLIIIFSLASMVVSLQWSMIPLVIWYLFSFFLAVFFLFVFYSVLWQSVVKQSPKDFFRRIKEVQLVAFITASSSSTLPISMKAAEQKLALPPFMTRAVIPWGIHMNMDGTALYQAVATVFLVQVFGISLGFEELLLILITTVSASIGAAAIPGGGLFILAYVLSSIGVPAAGIGIILSVEKLLDMSRTTVNVTADLVCCGVLNKIFRRSVKSP